jgi:hypothetical protein
MPLEGSARGLVYLDGAMTLAGSAILAGLALAIAVPPERRRLAIGVVAGAWLLTSIALAALYPSPLVRGAGLQRIYFAADLVGLLVAAGAVFVRGEANIAAKRSPDSAFIVALGLVLLTGGLLFAPFSPWRAALFDAPYFGPQLVIMVVFTVLAAAQVVAWKVRSSSG